jgi:cytochrome b6-f complex iron-sulfur subunit
MNRRDLIQRVLVGGTALVLMPSALTSCTKVTDPKPDPNPGGGGGPITIDLTAAGNSALNTTGGSKIVQGILVINTNGSNFVALSSACTHAGCTVGYESSLGSILCPCHGSSFTTNGSIITGPAATPLPSYPISKSGNILTIAV